MPTVTFDHATLRAIQSRHGVEHDPWLWEEKLSNIGCVVEECDSNEIEIEIFPDRADLLSPETLAHAARAFLHGKGGECDLATTDGEVTMNVDPSLENVRPIIYGAVVRGVDNGSSSEENDAFIQALMDHQEKLHFSIGRRRRRASIGVHDLSTLAPPFKVITVPESYSFVPLAMTERMSIREILESHPKGVDYAHLLDGFSEFPVIIDAADRVLSFPPIINGDHTTVTDSTTDFFIDVTGWDARACEASLLLICLAFSARGGVVETIELTDCRGEVQRTPNGKARRLSLPKRLLEEILGREFTKLEIRDAIDRMGGRYIEMRTVTDGPRTVERMADAAIGEQEYIIEMPRWRSDLLHPVDLVEEVATGIGYEDLGRALSGQSKAGIPLPTSHLNRRIRESLQANGLQQVTSLTLSNEGDQFDKIRYTATTEVTGLHNPITVDHTILRQSITPSLLNLLAANRHHELPQRVYELGTVVRDHHNAERVGWACAEVGTGFTAAKGMVEALLRDLGAYSREITVDYQPLSDTDGGPYLAGRGAKVMVAGEWVGCCGEIDPAISELFGLKVPIHCGEFDVDALGRLIPDPIL
ncbi:MAG: phenylalanine--tRNA ligase subunit beta [Candidatus Thalassarchaeaceae archaeon]|jgi:phenylalanyl-tRNA synthetase beta chain|nr:phenylalanine--tRNA ligase subunit beta [Candidatus Thalassarchaeaceae archaeon]